MAAERVPRYWLHVTEAEVCAMARGRLPRIVRTMAKTLTDWTFKGLRKNARKPVALTKARKGRV